MDNFNLKKYLAENKLEEEYRGQMGSQTAQDLAVSKARLSNAILALDSDNIRTAEEVENEYIRVGMMMKNHLKFLFDDYRPHPSLDQI